MASIEVSDEKLKELTDAIVLSMFSGEERTKIVTDAIKDLLTKEVTKGYGKNEKKISRFEEILERSLERMVYKRIEAYWESDEGKELIDTLVDKAIARIKETGPDSVYYAMADGIRAAIEKRY